MAKKFDLEAYKKKIKTWLVLPNTHSIYVIYNKINNKEYIGQTTRNINKRFKEHTYNKKSIISKAINKYGKENFDIVKLGSANCQYDADRLEFEHIYYLKTLSPNGYNISEGGRGYTIPWNKGLKLSPSWNKNIPNIKARKSVIATCIKTGKEFYYPATNHAPGYNSGHIVQCCKGKLNQHKGYYWRYSE